MLPLQVPVLTYLNVVVTLLKALKKQMQRGPREREARYLRFTIQCPGNSIYIPHFLAHAVLTVDTE